jgi:hypothetical protein
MPRSETTALYTRVDNSFSNPVFGTTIIPAHADTFFDDVEASMNAFIGTSTTSLAIGLGSKSFTTQAAKSFLVGMSVQAFSQANRANSMSGTVTSYDTGTGALVLEIITFSGTGTLADWQLMTAGARGGAGPVAGFRQTFDSSTSDADPGAGDFRLNHGTPGSATAGYFDNVDTAGGSVTTIIDKFDDSGSTVRGFLRLEKESDSAVWAEFNVTGSVVDGTGYRKVTLANGSSNGTFTAGDAFRISFSRSGDPGAIGGSTGSTDEAILRANGTGGATVQSSGVTIDDSNNVAGMASLTLTNTGLHLLDTNASHDLIIAPGSNLTADHTLTLTTGDADRALTISGDHTLIAGTSVVTAGNQTITGGYAITPFNAGTKSTGTYTPASSDGNYQYATNGGAHTLAAPANDCAIDILYTNNGSAGSITFSGFTVGSATGSALTTTDTSKFLISIRRINSVATYSIYALQ